jgi:uncharacterized Zn finger protein
MKIPLNEFEEVIDETILKRGLAYFKGGAITDFLEISNGEYEALVSGTEEYTVQLVINKNIITEHNCDCPYDMGAVCKHVVAVIFHLPQDKTVAKSEFNYFYFLEFPFFSVKTLIMLFFFYFK